MNSKGFSLVELIIVIAIMAIIVGILAPQFVKHVEQSRESKDIQTIDEIKRAIEAYSSEHEQKGTHTVKADGNMITYTLGDGGTLDEYGIKTQTVQSSSSKIKVLWTFSSSTWSVNDTCDASSYYDAYGNRK